MRAVGPAVGDAPVMLVMPTVTRLAAEEDKVALRTSTIPFRIAVLLSPKTKHVYEPEVPRHCTVFTAAKLEVPGEALIATTLPGS